MPINKVEDFFVALTGSITTSVKIFTLKQIVRGPIFLAGVTHS